jgi:hypothetical protein
VHTSHLPHTRHMPGPSINSETPKQLINNVQQRELLLLTRAICDTSVGTNCSLSAEYQKEISRLADGPLLLTYTKIRECPLIDLVFGVTSVPPDWSSRITECRE